VARKIKGAVRENLRTEIAIGISPEFHAPNQTYPAYLKARYGALINLIRSENHFFYPFPLEKRQIFLDELIQGVKKKSDESSVDVWIDRLLLPLFTPFLYRVVQWNVLKILCELSAKFPEKYPPGRLLSFASNILQLKTISELYQWTHQFLKMQIRIIQGIPKSYEVVNEIKKYVQDNYTSSSLKTLLSQKTKYSSTYLETLFRKQMGKGIAAYLTEIRIKRAKELLRETELTISEIAFEVGYNTFSTFYRAFKRMEKMAPAEYRAKVKGGE
jgi:AraC-like DNA-binding protein